MDNAIFKKYITYNSIKSHKIPNNKYNERQARLFAEKTIMHN